ncbi:hypothetical protein DICPUDRAFT_98707 [Dictyostelium purpureum]|uniref:Uncharacterized protein n=1 Tax=Dictyostelium purpureum TaxID=5786 RepID=F0ZSU8_DICPU|nr:uncharacterized protein DICPUDRAFT_98707 [Dictyostelium purpureum]EGC32984.1 hypothetical protein DICPUDRAFT_98707 [Dictyostelium purpureum]|eukprot:XP_003290502.1 hypothetical protein DICPUDRAFT_98707 [Dictyostelium purpureum]
MSSGQSDMDIALTSKRINMALDEFIKENKKDNRRPQRNNRGGNTRVSRADNRNHNNNNRGGNAGNVPCTNNTRPTTAINPEKIKIQIQNTKVSARKPAIGGLTRPKTRIGGAPRINLTRTARPSGVARGGVRSTTSTTTKKPNRIVQRYEKAVTLNDRFSKK